MHHTILKHCSNFGRLMGILLGCFLQILLISAPTLAMGSEVDKNTMSDRNLDTSIKLGKVVFDSKCVKCHGDGAKGTSRAPSLIHSADRLTPQQFSDRVLEGHVIVLGYNDVAGDDRTAVREAFVELLKKRENSDVVMPSWEGNPVVRSHILELYHYLKNLADSTLLLEHTEQESK